MPVRGYRQSEEHRKKIRENHKGFLGKKHSEETKRKLSEVHKKLGTRPPAGSHKGFKHSEETRKLFSKQRIGKKSWNKGKKYLQITGEKNYNWKGGITEINKKIRTSLEYKLWRTAVFERDKYTCIWCGTKKSPFNADHIKPFAYFPELRFAIDNGRTLCISCHKKTDTYGNKNRDKTGKFIKT